MKKLLMLIVSIALVCSSAYAATFKPVHDDVKNTLTISGTIDKYDYSSTLTLSVLKEGKSYESMEDTTKEYLKDSLAIFDIIMTADDGSYEVAYDVSGLALGEYKGVLTLEDGTVEEAPIMLVSRNVKTAFIDEVIKMIDDGTTATALSAKLDFKDENTNNSKMFGITKGSDILNVDRIGFASVLKKTIEDNIIKAGDKEFTLTPEEFVEVLGYCVKIQFVNEGKLNPAKDEETIAFFGLDKVYLETYEKKVSKDDKESYEEYFKNYSSLTTKDVADAFNKTVIDYIIKKAESWKDYKDIIETYGESLGIDMDDYEDLDEKDEISDYLDNSYTRVNKFIDDVNDAIEDLSDGGSSGSSSGGGGFAPVKGTEVGKFPLDMNLVTETDKKAGFNDLEGFDWAKEAILSLAGKWIVNGVGDGSFAPQNTVTREQFVKMIVLAMNIPLDATETSFTDVESGSWYTGFVSSAFKNGIVNGVSETSFGVGQSITREQVAVMLYRASKLNKTEAEATFTDNAEIAEYAKEAIDTLSSLGVINGIDGAFKPKATATRAEAAVMIYRLLGVLNK